MSISNILATGTSGIMAAQAQIRVASDNIANVNTAGYARKVANQESLVVGGVGMGAHIASITRVADIFLQKAALASRATSGQAGVMADFFDQAQSLFGDPSESSSFAGRLDSIYSALSAASESPSSSLNRSAVIASVNDFLDEADRISGSLKTLTVETGKQIDTKVARANEILKQLGQTNVDITRINVGGGDSSGSANIQSQLLDELAGLMDIQISARNAGGVAVRASNGTLLVGDGGASTLAYDTSQGVGQLLATPPSGSPQIVTTSGGALDGLMRMSKVELPKLADQLSEFVAQAVDELNRAHNANTAVPAPDILTGRNTGLDSATAVSGFTGQTRIAIVDSAGVVQRTVDIDFDAGSMSVNGGPPVSDPSFAANFVANLNTALSPAGTAQFTGGALRLSAPGAGVVVSDDPADPATKAGKGFSHFFGLNDLVTSPAMTQYATGLASTDAHGFTPGGVMTLNLTDSAGNLLQKVPVTVPAAGSMASLLSSMNASVAQFGQFSLDADGRMTFAAVAGQDVLAVVASDTTARGAGGPSITALFGIGAASRATRTDSFSIRSDISTNYNRLAFAQFDRSATAGTAALAVGDGRGALALSQAGAKVSSFGAAGDMRAAKMSVLAYAAELSGQIAAKSSSAKARQESADAVATEAETRRATVEGVNLDEEFVNLTTFQQAYNASARLITAAKDMYDVLLGILD